MKNKITSTYNQFKIRQEGYNFHHVLCQNGDGPVIMHLSIYKALLSATEGIVISSDKIICLYLAAVYSLCKTTDTHKRVERREPSDMVQK